MSGFEGALEFSLTVMMYLLRFVLAALVLWLIVGGVRESLPGVRGAEPPDRPGSRAR